MKEQTTNSNPTALTRCLVAERAFRLMAALNVLDDSTEDQWDDEGWRERLAQLRAEKMPKRDLLRCPASRHKALAIKREA